jgi:magnesium-transporting ATPase (P-type)
MPRVSEVPRVVELGLTSDQAARLLTERGPNRLPVQHPTPWWRRLAAEMVHFFALLFWVAGGSAFVAGLPQLGIAILVVVVLNGVFAFARKNGPSMPPRGSDKCCPAEQPCYATV